MKNIIKLIFILSTFSVLAISQNAWKVGGNILGTEMFMTGKLSTALADSSIGCDSTNGATTIYSATLSNSVYLMSGKVVRVGYVVIDSALAARTITATVSIDVQSSLNGSVWNTVVDSAVSYKVWLPTGTGLARTGSFNLGTATLTNIKAPYFRLAMRPTGALNSSTATASGVNNRFRWIIIP